MLETNELTQKLRTLLHPRAALIAYAEGNDCHNLYNNHYFVEVRDIDDKRHDGGRPPRHGGFHERTGARLFRKPQHHALRQDSVQYAVVRPTQRQREIHLVQSPAETDDVLQEALKIENAEYICRESFMAGNMG